MTRRVVAALGAVTFLLILAVVVMVLADRESGWRTQDATPSRSASSEVAESAGIEVDPHLREVAESPERHAPPVADVPLPSADAPSSVDTRPTQGTRFSGRAVDDLGQPLAGHTIEVYALSDSPGGARTLEAQAQTNSTGRFRIEAITPGPKRIVLCGPGEGDIWHELPDLQGYHNRREERDLMLGIPEAGVRDFVFRGAGHMGVLVTARAVDDLGRRIESWGFELRDGSHREGMLMNIEGELSGIVPVYADGDFEVQQYVHDHTAESDPFSRTRFLPLTVPLSRGRNRVDLGTLVVPRMACLRLTLADGSNGMGIGGADVWIRCTGGGQEVEEMRPELNRDGSYHVRSGRSAGEFELEITAAGYRPFRQVGLLMAGDEPYDLEVKLERTR